MAGWKGNLAAGIDLIYESLLTPALDEISAEYGLIAEAVSYPPDFSSVASVCGRKHVGTMADRSRLMTSFFPF